MSDARVIVIDFETTGLSPNAGDRATEVAAVVVERGRVVERFESLMNAGVPIPHFIQQLTGITDAMIRRAPPASEVMRELAGVIGQSPLVAHNAGFDRRFLASEFARVGIRQHPDMACSMLVARRIYPTAPDHKLPTLARYLRLRPTGQHHRALADAELAADLWLRMQRDVRDRFELRRVPFALLRDVQCLPRHGLEGALHRLRAAHGV